MVSGEKLSELLGVTVRTLKTLRADPTLPVARLGARTVLYDLVSVEEYLSITGGDPEPRNGWGASFESRRRVIPIVSPCE